MKKYYVYTERQADRNPLTDTSVHLAQLELRAVEVTMCEEEGLEDMMDYWENHDDYEQDLSTYIDDLQGGAEIINTPDDFDPEFTNGLCDHGFFDTFEEAKVVYDSFIKGTINYSKLESY